MEGRRRWRGFEDAGGMLTISSIESFHFANYSSLFGGTVLQRQRSVEAPMPPRISFRSIRATLATNMISGQMGRPRYLHDLACFLRQCTWRKEVAL